MRLFYNINTLTICILGLFLIGGCSSNSSAPRPNNFSGFTKVPSKTSGIQFANMLEETASNNYYSYEYMYNGGGVAIGDINNDGLDDIYLTGNQREDKLYINQGDLAFKDVTKSNGISNQSGWHTGVNMVDINADGWLDIYVCRSGWYKDPTKRANLLYVNNQDGTFSEKASQFGIADTSHSVQSVFFDMDNDGDLDMFLGNHPVNLKNLDNFKLYNILQSGTSPTDMLYRNDNGVFTNVTKTSGIYNFSYTLGISVADYNHDGFQDIFVSADYEEPDKMYINQGNGTFKNVEQEVFNHIANFGMGSDAADFNNDGYTDLFNVDMAFADPVRSKTNMPSMSPKKFYDRVKIGFHHQYMHNCLHMNLGNGTFSDVAYLSGVAKSDWSWATFFADFDNDRKKDLFISNGYRRDVMNNDYQTYLSSLEGKVDLETVFKESKTTFLPNFLFRNEGDLKFSDVSSEWGMTEKINSNGAAYSDLDNDGDLDIVINHMDKRSAVYENVGGNSSNYIRLKLKGIGKNSQSYGTEIELITGDDYQLYHQQPARGYQSSVSPIINIGLGDAEKIDTLRIKWSGGTTETILTDVNANQLLELDRSKLKKLSRPAKKEGRKLFNLIDNIADKEVKHSETDYNDFKKEILLPHKQSQMGPSLAVGDINNDGSEDFYIGGAAGFSGKLFLQQKNAPFTEVSGPWVSDKASEDIAALFFDADGDGDNDLYVVSGSNEFPIGDKRYQDRLYINNKGSFTKSNGLPNIRTSGEAICAADVDKDGDLDLFVGGRQIPGKYPYPANSKLLINENGKFKDATSSMAPDFNDLGMVTDAVFTDFDKDGDKDLMITGEWMPITLFENSNGAFKNITDSSIPDKTNGWWWSIAAADIDGDGDDDYVLGNLGHNSKFSADKDKPFFVYANDFDNSGNLDIVLSFEDKKGTLRPVRGRECSSEQMPFIVDKFPDFQAYAEASISEIHEPEMLDEALKYSAYNFNSSILWNEGADFTLEALPNQAQTGPIKDIVILDINQDGHKDIIAAGNMFNTEVETSRYDGGFGYFLAGNGERNFTFIPPSKSGFLANKDVKNLSLINIMGNQAIIVANNNDIIQTFVIINQSS